MNIQVKEYINTLVTIIKKLRTNPRETGLSLWNALLQTSFISGTVQNDIGISIGHQNIVAVELDKTQEVPCMTRLAVRKLTDEHSDITTILKEMFEQENFSNTTINTSLSGKSIIVRFIKFPKMNKRDLRSALEFEAEKYIPFDVSEVYLDFDILRSDDSRKYVEVALVVAKKDSVHELLDASKAANLTTRSITIDAFSCFNTFLAAYPSEKEKTVVLANTGAQLTNLMIVSQGVPVFSRDIYFGGDDITKGLSKKLHIDIAEAAKLKYNLKDTQDGKVEGAIREILSYLITEMKLSFDYFETQICKEKDTIASIYLIGGSSRLDGLSEILHEELTIKTQLFDPLRSVTVDDSVNQQLLQEYAASLAVPIGLAII